MTLWSNVPSGSVENDMVNNNIPLCKDCVHHIQGAMTVHGRKPDTCAYAVTMEHRRIEKSSYIDLVDGKTKYREHHSDYLTECSIQRSASWMETKLLKRCGKEGRFFTKKFKGIPFSGDPEDDPVLFFPPDFEDYV